MKFLQEFPPKEIAGPLRILDKMELYKSFIIINWWDSVLSRYGLRYLNYIAASRVTHSKWRNKLSHP